MTPLLGTTGGGSGRGFGRGFKGAAAPAGPSAAPSGLSATPAYAGSSTTAQMSLSWTNGDATATTEIYNNTTSTLVTTVSAGTTSYTVTGLNANASYSFKVRHLKNSQYSSYTSNASNTTYDYNGHFIAVRTGTHAGYTDPFDVYSTWDEYADGYGGLSYSLHERLSTSSDVVFRHDDGTAYYTVPSGVSTIMVLATGAGGDCVQYETAAGGGAGAQWIRISVSTGNSIQMVWDAFNGSGWCGFTRPGLIVQGFSGVSGNGTGLGGAGNGSYISTVGTTPGRASETGFTPNEETSNNTSDHAQWGGGAGYTSGYPVGGRSRCTPYGKGAIYYSDSNQYVTGTQAIIAVVENPTI